MSTTKGTARAEPNGNPSHAFLVRSRAASETTDSATPTIAINPDTHSAATSAKVRGDMTASGAAWLDAKSRAAAKPATSSTHAAAEVPSAAVLIRKLAIFSRCPSNAADQLRSGAFVYLRRGRTRRRLCLQYGCRPELRQLHPLVGWRSHQTNTPTGGRPIARRQAAN